MSGKREREGLGIADKGTTVESPVGGNKEKQINEEVGETREKLERGKEMVEDLPLK